MWCVEDTKMWGYLGGSFMGGGEAMRIFGCVGRYQDIWMTVSRDSFIGLNGLELIWCEFIYWSIACLIDRCIDGLTRRLIEVGTICSQFRASGDLFWVITPMVLASEDSIWVIALYGFGLWRSVLNDSSHGLGPQRFVLSYSSNGFAFGDSFGVIAAIVLASGNSFCRIAPMVSASGFRFER